MPQPDLIITPFAQDAPPNTVDPIPETRSPTDPLEKATWTQGFPGLTMIPLAAGGIPPRGQDFNGVLKAISEHTVFQGGGGQYKWSAEYVAAHGGYSVGAVIQSDDGLSSYVSAVDENTINPNTTPGSIGNQWLASGGAAKANASTTITAGLGLTGGGDLTQNRTLSVSFGETAGTAVEGNDPRIAGPREWIAETVSESEAVAGTSTTRRAWTAQRVFQAFRGAAANATEALRGTLRVGTQSEIDEGVLDNIAVTPKKLRMGFSIVLSPTGYIALPSWLGGWIVQWANGITDSSGVLAVALPISYPSNHFGTLAGVVANTGGTGVQSYGKTLNSTVVRTFNTASGSSLAGANVFLISIGS